MTRVEIVEAPDTTLPADILDRMARMRAIPSNPPCLMNRLSSAAMRACGSHSPSLSNATGWLKESSSDKNSRRSLPSSACICVEWLKSERSALKEGTHCHRAIYGHCRASRCRTQGRRIFHPWLVAHFDAHYWIRAAATAARRRKAATATCQ